jgi:hypothetical protein
MIIMPCYFKAEVVHACQSFLKYGEDNTTAWEEYMYHLYGSPPKLRDEEEAEGIRDWMAKQELIEETHPIGFTWENESDRHTSMYEKRRQGFAVDSLKTIMDGRPRASQYE